MNFYIGLSPYLFIFHENCGIPGETLLPSVVGFEKRKTYLRTKANIRQRNDFKRIPLALRRGDQPQYIRRDFDIRLGFFHRVCLVGNNLYLAISLTV